MFKISSYELSQAVLNSTSGGLMGGWIYEMAHSRIYTSQIGGQEDKVVMWISNT